jgi:hypothetical protein
VTLDLIFDRLRLPLKGVSFEKTYTGKLSNVSSITFTGTDVVHSSVDFLREFEAIFKKAFACVYQGPRGSCLILKTSEVEDLVSGSL